MKELEQMPLTLALAGLEGFVMSLKHDLGLLETMEHDFLVREAISHLEKVQGEYQCLMKKLMSLTVKNAKTFFAPRTR